MRRRGFSMLEVIVVLGMAALVETHDLREIERAIPISPAFEAA